MDKQYKEYPDKIKTLLKSLIDELEDEDSSVRERQLRTWRQLKLFWENFRNNYYDDVAHDWRIPSQVRIDENNDQSYYDKPVNILRAYLESIIAALSITVPAIKCFPDDADNSLDLETAKAGDEIAKLLYRHNDVGLVWLHGLWLYVTEGMVASYIKSDSNEEYGTFTQEKYQTAIKTQKISTCPSCGNTLDDEMLDYRGEEPANQDVLAGEPIPELCEACGQLVSPEVNYVDNEVSELVKSETKNKVRQHICAYGGLNVRVPNWARNQKECMYLGYDYETHYANALEKYPHLFGEIDTGIFNPYETWARLSPQYYGEYPKNNVTCRHRWLRPAAFNMLQEDEMKELKKLFPKGVRVDLVNDVYAGAEPENLDDCWTLTYNPFSDYVHSDPIGLLLVSVQEITNDLISLTLQTVEHGIGQTFADPSVLNFNAYRQMEVVPGGVYPATPKAGKALGEGFYEVKTATLSQEVMPFGQQIQNLGQLVSGALPSLFGGGMDEQKTASGYAMSRAQALQRLQNVWKIFTIWWKITFSKAIPKYIEQVEWDEKEVKLDTVGNFVNTFIRKASLEGKIGRYELEANENLPVTWAQRKDTIMKLLELNNPLILQHLGSPENLPLIREAIGLDDFNIQGENSRNKQFEEIRLLMEGQPMPIGMDPMGMPIEGPSIEVDPDFDIHPIEFSIVQFWANSEAGRLAKTENPDGYRNVLLHGKMHLQTMQMQAMQQMMPPEGGSGAPPEGPQEDQNAPIQGEGDVPAQI